MMKCLYKSLVKKRRKSSSATSDVITEDQENQKKLKWLKEYGELTEKEGKNAGEESSVDESSSTWHTIVESIISNINCYEYFGSTATLLRPSKKLN